MNHNILIYLIGFLKELLQHSNVNHLTVDILSQVFASSFVRLSYVAKKKELEDAKKDEKIMMEARRGMKMVLHYFLSQQ